VVAKLAPEQMRGRYMAFYGFAWSVPGAVGMYLSGLILDYFQPNWIWFASAIIGIIAALAFWFMNFQETRRSTAEVYKEPIPEIV
jgi:MFS family permease